MDIINSNTNSNANLNDGQMLRGDQQQQRLKQQKYNSSNTHNENPVSSPNINKIKTISPSSKVKIKPPRSLCIPQIKQNQPTLNPSNTTNLRSKPSSNPSLQLQLQSPSIITINPPLAHPHTHTHTHPHIQQTQCPSISITQQQTQHLLIPNTQTNNNNNNNNFNNTSPYIYTYTQCNPVYNNKLKGNKIYISQYRQKQLLKVQGIGGKGKGRGWRAYGLGCGAAEGNDGWAPEQSDNGDDRRERGVRIKPTTADNIRISYTSSSPKIRSRTSANPSQNQSHNIHIDLNPSNSPFHTGTICHLNSYFISDNLNEKMNQYMNMVIREDGQGSGGEGNGEENFNMMRQFKKMQINTEGMVPHRRIFGRNTVNTASYDKNLRKGKLSSYERNMLKNKKKAKSSSSQKFQPSNSPNSLIHHTPSQKIRKLFQPNPCLTLNLTHLTNLNRTIQAPSHYKPSLNTSINYQSVSPSNNTTGVHSNFKQNFHNQSPIVGNVQFKTVFGRLSVRQKSKGKYFHAV